MGLFSNITQQVQNHHQALNAINQLTQGSMLGTPLQNAQALTNNYLEGYSNALIDQILENPDGLPQSILDRAIRIIENWVDNQSANVPPSVQESVDNSEAGQEATANGYDDGMAIGSSAAADVEAAAADSTGDSEGTVEEDGEAGGSEGGTSALDTAVATGIESGEVEEGGGPRGGKSWLVALASRLGEMQGNFMDKAQANLNNMESASGDTQSGDFITAQNEFSANMQMFSMMANASSTALKSLGEGMSALARKQ